MSRRASDPSRLAPSERMALLTQREADVMHLLLQEHSNKVVAAMLDLSPKTVSEYKQNLFRRIGVKGIVGMAILAHQAGLV